MIPWTVVLWQTDTLLQEGHCSLSVPIWFLLTGWKLSPLNKQECKVEMAKWEFCYFSVFFSKKCRICWTFVTAISFISPTQISSLAMPAVARIWSREWWSRVELPIQINVKWSQNVPFCGLWWGGEWRFWGKIWDFFDVWNETEKCRNDAFFVDLSPILGLLFRWKQGEESEWVSHLLFLSNLEYNVTNCYTTK